jgi:hypothetical protein
MVDPQLIKRWKVTEALLARARRHLLRALPEIGEGQAQQLQQVDEYLVHNELGLAMEVLADIGAEHQCRGAFWRDLERAAESMELLERSVEYRERFHAALQNS